jgi:hypothetical protein
MTTTLHIGTQEFAIDAAQDTDLLPAEILAGSRESAYVHFTAQGRGDVSVLMTPGMSARFEVDTPTDMTPCDPGVMVFDFWPGDLD